jgi:hypothetical protein
MMAIRYRHALLGALALALGACSEALPPPRERPAPVERPVLPLKSDTARLRVPSAALVERGGVPGVYVLSPESEARFRMVRPGRVVGTETEILAGLKGGEVLVLGDVESLHDGNPITAGDAAK